MSLVIIVIFWGPTGSGPGGTEEGYAEARWSYDFLEWLCGTQSYTDSMRIRILLCSASAVRHPANPAKSSGEAGRATWLTLDLTFRGGERRLWKGDRVNFGSNKYSAFCVVCAAKERSDGEDRPVAPPSASGLHLLRAVESIEDFFQGAHLRDADASDIWKRRGKT
ncbi:hypothetical protein B0H11DRAFT_2303792 [Mycena galericulata]|nr:hypothetical protein B0H11DRAFT_2303792 [Mycena galericulata]